MKLQPLTKQELERKTLVVFVTQGTGLSTHCTVESHFPPVGQEHIFGHLSNGQLLFHALKQEQQLIDRGVLLESRWQ